MSNTYGYVGNPATQGGSSGNRGIFDTKDVIHQKKLGTWRYTPIDVEFLVLGGGGGSVGQNGGGGGGGGGHRASYADSNINVITVNANGSTDHTVEVGAGGSQNQATGGNSVFESITSTGGGRGGGSSSLPETGGSGGGGRNDGNLAGASGNAGAYFPAEGYNGGNGHSQFGAGAGGGGGGAGGGGGGAGGANNPGPGGAGRANAITGTSIGRGGGGAGRGEGGGTDNASSGGGTSNANGSAGYGGGAGGGSKVGGSGKVILRYPNTYTINVGAGLTAGSETAVGNDKYIEFTAGSGSVRWSYTG